MGFQMIGVQFNQAGNEQIALQVEADREAPFLNLGDHAVANDDVARGHPIGKNNAGICQDNGRGGH